MEGIHSSGSELDAFDGNSRKIGRDGAGMMSDNGFVNLRDASAEAIESFYLETREQLFFAIKGLEHPADRWIAVLRYAPDAQRGTRKKGGALFRRLYHFAEQEEFLGANSQYLAYDPVFGTTLQSVPRSLVQRIYEPRARLIELVKAGGLQGPEMDAAAFAGLLRKEAGVPWPGLGITGSLLIGMHTAESDLDIAVYGAQNCRKVHRALQKLLEDRSFAELRRLDERGVEELYAQRTADTRMPFDEFVQLEKRKVNQGVFRARPYFVRFIKEIREAGPAYGQLRYAPIGRAAITASIADDREAIFTPCRYNISGVRFLNGTPVENLGEIISFRGRFCEQAQTGEAVTAAGTLERVQNSRGDSWHRLLLGNSPEDTMLVLK